MTRTRTLSFAASALLCAGAATAQTALHQAMAMAGGLSALDTPGFPIVITSPGSYRLTGNLQVPAHTTGIHVMADNVFIDLNGYALRGPVRCSWQGPASGVACNQSLMSGADGIRVHGDGISIRNGNVLGFAGTGIQLTGGNATVQNVHVQMNVDGGISAGADSSIGPSRLSGVHVWLNRGPGIRTVGAIVERATVWRNHGAGILGSAMHVIDSLVHQNQQQGLAGDGTTATTKGTTLINNGAGPSAGVISLGGNFDGTAPF